MFKNRFGDKFTRNFFINCMKKLYDKNIFLFQVKLQKIVIVMVIVFAFFTNTKAQATGDFKTVAGGTWLGATPTAVWQIYNIPLPGWNATLLRPAANTSQTIFVDHVLNANGSFGSAVNIVVNNGGNFVVSAAAAAETLLVNTGGILQINAALSLNSTGSFIIENGGRVNINNATTSGTSTLWDAVENFKTGSIVEIQNWNYGAGTAARLIQSPGVISANSNGYYFGNLTISGNPTSLFVLVAGSQTINLAENDFTIATAATSSRVAFTNATANVTIGGNLNVLSDYFSFAATTSGAPAATIKGNINGNAGTIDLNQTSSGAAASSVLLKGNLNILSGAVLRSTDAGCKIVFNNAGLQTINVAGTLGANAAFEVAANSITQIVNQNLSLSNASNKIDILTGGILDFNYRNITGPGDFILATGGGLYITDGMGIYAATATGNVQNTGTRSFSQTGYFYFTGNTTPQNTGTAITATSTAKRIFIAKNNASDIVNLTQTTGITDVLNISKGILVETPSAFITGSGNLIMNADATYKIAVTGAALLPQLSGSYLLSGASVIELNGNGNQVLRGTRDYRNLNFSAAGFKTLSSPPSSVTGTVYVAGNAILDIGSNNFGNAATNLSMDAGRFRMSSTGTSPDIDGVFNLSGGVIEFYNTSATRQTIKGKNFLGNDIIYYEIEVTGNNIGQSNTDILLNSTAGKFSVSGTSPAAMAAMYMSNRSIKSVSSVNSSSFLLNAFGTLITSASKGFSGYTTTFGDNSSIHSNISSANINLLAGSTVEYGGVAAQDISNQVAYQNFVLSNAGAKTAPSGVLEINGNIKTLGSAIFAHNNGTVLLNGLLGQTYDATNPITFYNLTNNSAIAGGGFFVNDSLNIVKELRLNTLSALKLNTGNITLKSSQALNANLAQVPAGEPGIIQYTGAGRFFVERFINSGRKWRFLSVPADAEGGSVRSNWMEAAANKDQDLKPGFGTLVTDNTVNAMAVGFDTFSVSGPSIKYYVPATGLYNGIANPGVMLNGQEGYMSFVRGDRSARLTNALVPPTVLRTKGKLITGTKSVTIPAAVNYFPVGNPYASALDLKIIKSLSTGVGGTFVIWDPKLTGGFGLGAFQYLTQLSPGGDFIITPGGGSYGSIGSVVNEIQSGAAFFVQGSGAGGSVNITESAKSSNFADVYFANNVQTFSAVLKIKSASGTSTIVDGTTCFFVNEADSNANDNDALKLQNNSENVSIKRNNFYFAVEQRKLPHVPDTIFLHLTGLRLAPYQWQFITAGLNQDLYTAFLEDKYLHVKSPLSMDTATFINFDVSNTPESFTADRFMIVFQKKSSIPCTEFKFTGISANMRLGDSTEINFYTFCETGIDSFIVEKSTDGNHFFYLGFFSAQHNNGGSASYKFIEKANLSSTVYYRIKAIKQNAAVVYSDTKKIAHPLLNGRINVVPNPVHDKIIHLKFYRNFAGKYFISLFNKAGAKVFETVFIMPDNTGVYNISVPKTIARGAYTLVCVDEEGEKNTINLFIE